MMKSELKRALILVEFYKIRKKKLSDLSNTKRWEGTNSESSRQFLIVIILAVY